MINTRTNDRLLIIFLLYMGLYATITIYLAFIQLVHTSFFTTLGSQQYTITLNQLPTRAPIFDRSGHYLACNKECLSAFVIPNQLRDQKKLDLFLENHFPHARDHIRAHQKNSFAYIKRRLSDEDIVLITDAQIPDIHFVWEANRFYPIATAAPLVGFTDIDNVGQAGIELYCNSQLTGSATKVCLEKDARSGYFYFHKELKEQGTASKPVNLTIDRDLQFLVDQEVAHALEQYHAKEGAALIVNPTSGEILAMASHPFSTPQSASFRMQDSKQRIVTDSYELGSVMKVAAAIAALEEGVVTPDELIDCKNKTTCTIDGRIVNTLAPHGRIPFYDVIAFSNNIGIAQIAKRLDTKLYDHYEKMGFGSKTNIPLPAENKGFINHPARWSKQSIISLSYGYEIRTTLVQLAALFCMIANNGIHIPLQLIMLQENQLPDHKLYSSETMDAIKDILRRTTDHGTGWRSQLKGYDVMTKTGTANMLENGTYRHRNDLLSCAGIIQKGSYKRVIITFIKEPTIPHAYAATIAVPLFKHIAEKMIIHERII